MESEQKKKSIKDIRRYKNLIIFMAIYFIMGAIKGLNGDVLMSFVHLTMPHISTGMTIYIGISMILLVIAIISIKGVGYKKVLLTLTILLVVSTVGIMYVDSNILSTIFIIIIELDHKAFLTIIPLILMAYTDSGNRVSIFAKAIFLNVLGDTIATFFDGKIVVLKLKYALGISYGAASKLTTHVKTLNSTQIHAYVEAYKFAIWISAILAIILFALILFTREEKVDYKNTAFDLNNAINKSNIEVFTSKYIIAWIGFMALLSIDSNLVGPNIPIYLNRVLHISRGVTSTLVSLESLGMMVFVITAPWVIKRMGRIKHFSLFLLFSVPLMLLIGFGNIFGSYITIALGTIMFIRWGCTHSYHPTMDILPLTFVTKENRPVLTAVITLFSGILSVIVGLFGKKYLFRTMNGYHQMFYIIAVVYVIASILIFSVYYKKYDKLEEEA